MYGDQRPADGRVGVPAPSLFPCMCLVPASGLSRHNDICHGVVHSANPRSRRTPARSPKHRIRIIATSQEKETSRSEMAEKNDGRRKTKVKKKEKKLQSGVRRA